MARSCVDGRSQLSPCSAKRSSSVRSVTDPSLSPPAGPRFGRWWMRIRATALFEQVICNCFVTDPSARASGARGWTPCCGTATRSDGPVLLPVPQFMAPGSAGPVAEADAASAVGQRRVVRHQGVAHLSFPTLAARRTTGAAFSPVLVERPVRERARPAERRWATRTVSSGRSWSRSWSGAGRSAAGSRWWYAAPESATTVGQGGA